MRNNRGGNDPCRLHLRLLFHLLRRGLPLARNCSLHFLHQSATERTGWGPSLYETLPRKFLDGRSFLFSPQSGHGAAIDVARCIQLHGDGEKGELRSGDSVVEEGDVEHRAAALKNSDVLDVFVPYRNEYAQ